MMTLISASLPMYWTRLFEGCDPWEADLVVWAMDNGFPDFQTVPEYAR